MKTWTLATVGLLLTVNAIAAEPPPSGKPLSKPLKPAVTQNCPEYIQSATWVYRYSADYPFNEWMLSLVPTACGRYIDPSETAYMFYEIVKKAGQSKYWTNNRGMINQLTCHLYAAREKPEWNLEPWRPYVGYSKTLAAGCNPVEPDPDPAYH
jgi:hypothetical protein